MNFLGRFRNDKNKRIFQAWEHTGWGNTIKIFDWDERQLVGWLTPMPNEGDEVRIKMESGKVARFEITKMEPCGDPVDMFFADVKDVGYL